MDAKMACADGIQECIETVRDLKANNAEGEYIQTWHLHLPSYPALV